MCAVNTFDWHSVLQELPVRHTLDVMHIEKNVALTVMGFILGDADTIAVRKEMQQAGVMPELHLVQDCTGNAFRKPHAPYVLRKEQKRILLKTIRSVQTPSGHCANFAKLVNLKKEKLQFLKTHD